MKKYQQKEHSLIHKTDKKLENTVFHYWKPRKLNTQK